MPDQKFIYKLWQSQKFCARQKDDLHLVNSVLVSAKKNRVALNAVQFFGLAQNIWTGPKHLGTCRRTRR